MLKKQVNKLKSAVVSGVVALSALAAPFSAAVTPSLTATAAGTDDYAKLLQYSLYLYDANMCGSDVGEKSALSWRDDCHTSDEVKGGFHDAGDHVMFGLPQGYTASSLGWSYYEFKDAYIATGQDEHLKVILDHFCEFFKDSTQLSGNNVSRFLYQKGDGDIDHGYWGPPEAQGGSRKMFWTSGGASDIAADYAAALALNYINFGNAEDLKYAEALYNFSTQHNTVATDGPNTFYKSSGCQDEQANAAGWLYLATKNEKYKNDCASKQTQYLGWVDGWDNRGLGAACVYAHITNDWGKVNSYIGGQASGSNYLFMDKWGSARLNTTMQFCALVATKNSNADFKNWAKGQMDYITGSNPANKCFVVGFASNSAKNAHHRAASGYTSYEQFNMNNWDPNGDHMNPFSEYGPNSHLLVGALVGGPCDASGTYHDNMGDYICNEVAIDYNAGFVGASAGLYHFYGTGSTVSSIDGVDKIYKGGNTTPPSGTTTTKTPSVITTTTTRTPSVITTTTKAPSSTGGNGKYELKVNESYNYANMDSDERMIPFLWADFGIGAGEKVTKVEVNISSSKSIGKWQGAFGTSTKVDPDYWTMTDEMSKSISGTSGTITWNVPSATADIIQYNYGGELKFGVWWIDCTTFNIDSVVVYTNGSSSSTTTNKITTRTTTTRTPSVITTTTKAPSSTGGNGKYELKVNESYNYANMDSDERMIPFLWADFGIGAGEKVTKVEVNISSSKSIGKWQGAFGTSTKVDPDYWTMTDEMSKSISGTSGTITWNVPSATADIIQYNYGGELKFGVWWIDCTTFNIDSVVVYTSGSSSSTTTSRTTRTTTTTTRTTTTTTKPITPSVTPTKYGDANNDGVVNMADAVTIMQAVANPNKYSLSAQGRANADVSGNGDGITNKDALAIQKYKLGIISRLPE